MVNRDQVPLLLGIGAIVVTLAVGTCSTNARIDDLGDTMNSRFDDMNNRFDDLTGTMNNRFDDVNRRFDDVNNRFDDVNRRIDDVNGRIDDVNGRIDNVQTDVRELRGLLFDSLKSDAPAN